MIRLVAALSLACSAASFGAAPTREWERFSVLTPAGPEEPAPEVFGKLKRLVYAEHKVARGENNAWQLARAFGTTAMSLQTTNNDELVIMYPGKKLLVHNKDGLLYEVRKPTETLSSIVARYRKDKRAARKLLEAAVLANRLPGAALLGDFEFSRGERVLLPEVKLSFDTYRFPFAGGWARISSRFGSRYHPILKRRKQHAGLDLPKPYGTPVFPSRSGKVVEAGWKEGYGQIVVIRHTDGFTTRYGHLSAITVKEGQTVSRLKTMIGRVGSTGLSTGPHLHFEVRDRSGRAVNPAARIGKR